MLGRQYVGLELNDEPKDKADLTNIMSNSHINEHFNSLAREVSLKLKNIFAHHQSDINELFNNIKLIISNLTNFCCCVYFSWIFWNLRHQMMCIKLG